MKWLTLAFSVCCLIPSVRAQDLDKARDNFLDSLATLVPRGLTIAPKTFDAKDGKQALGFEYALHEQMSAWGGALVCRVDATGNVAFDKTLNPNDFLDSKLSLAFAKNIGGVRPIDWSMVPNEWTPEFKEKLADERMELAKIKDQDELDEAIARQEALPNSLTSRLSNQVYVEAGATGGLEANQDFTDRQWTFGAQVGAKLNLWERSSRKWNIFDYPFALLRALSSKGGGVE